MPNYLYGTPTAANFSGQKTTHPNTVSVKGSYKCLSKIDGTNYTLVNYFYPIASIPYGSTVIGITGSTVGNASNGTGTMYAIPKSSIALGSGDYELAGAEGSTQFCTVSGMGTTNYYIQIASYTSTKWGRPFIKSNLTNATDAVIGSDILICLNMATGTSAASGEMIITYVLP